MKRNVHIWLLQLLMLILLVGCSTTSVDTEVDPEVEQWATAALARQLAAEAVRRTNPNLPPEVVFQDPPLDGVASVVFNRPLEFVRKAAAEALTQAGWTVVWSAPAIVVGEKVPTRVEAEENFDPFRLARKKLGWMKAVPVKQPDGTIITQAPDGTKLVEFPDGALVLIQSDGQQWVKPAGKEPAVVLPDGSMYEVKHEVDKTWGQIWLKQLEAVKTRVSVVFALDWIIPELEKTLGRSQRE